MLERIPVKHSTHLIGVIVFERSSWQSLHILPLKLVAELQSSLRILNPQALRAMIGLGWTAVKSRLAYHQTVQDALRALHRASKLGPPSFEEEVLQISIGGNVESMMIGNFLPSPCQLRGGEHDPTIRCAHGFKVEKSMKTSQGWSLIPLVVQSCIRGDHKPPLFISILMVSADMSCRVHHSFHYMHPHI